MGRRCRRRWEEARALGWEHDTKERVVVGSEEVVLLVCCEVVIREGERKSALKVYI